MESKQQSSWGVDELSYLYHLIMWGYSNIEVRDILVTIGFGRSSDSIAGQVSMMRKFITKELGMPVKHWDVGPLTTEKFRKATNSGVPDLILSYKKNKDLVLPRKSPEVIPAEIPIPEPPTPVTHPVIEKEPDILDVMKMAKELGAAEVEYKGMKIKY